MMRPLASRMRSRVTCDPKQPSTWWFPPCTSAAERDELCPGRDRHEPAARQEQVVDVVQRQAGLGAHQAALLVEGEDTIGERRAHHLAIARRRQRRVAVRATETPRQRAPVDDPLQVFRADLVRGHARVLAPARQHVGFHGVDSTITRVFCRRLRRCVS
jgi:hypothetical protein